MENLSAQHLQILLDLITAELESKPKMPMARILLLSDLVAVLIPKVQALEAKNVA